MYFNGIFHHKATILDTPIYGTPKWYSGFSHLSAMKHQAIMVQQELRLTPLKYFLRWLRDYRSRSCIWGFPLSWGIPNSMKNPNLKWMFLSGYFHVRKPLYGGWSSQKSPSPAVFDETTLRLLMTLLSLVSKDQYNFGAAALLGVQYLASS